MSERTPELLIRDVDALVGACTLEVVFDFGTAAALDRGAKMLKDVCAAFALAGHFGAYARTVDSRHEATMAAAAPTRLSDLQVVVQLVASNLAPKAFQFLRNMLGNLVTVDAPVRSIRVSPRGASGEAPIARLPPVTQFNESSAYPDSAITPAVFELVWSDSDFSKLRRVQVQFRSPPPVDLRVQLGPWVDAWYQLLELGAFSSPFGLPFETQSVRGELTLFDETSYEISVSRFIASEAGFRVLANMLGHFSRRVLPIAKVEID
jgi:hypothetical protein